MLVKAKCKHDSRKLSRTGSYEAETEGKMDHAFVFPTPHQGMVNVYVSKARAVDC